MSDKLTEEQIKEQIEKTLKNYPQHYRWTKQWYQSNPKGLIRTIKEQSDRTGQNAPQIMSQLEMND